MAEDSKKDTIIDLIKLLSKEVPDTREELLKTAENRLLHLPKNTTKRLTTEKWKNHQ